MITRRALGKCRGVQDHRPSSEPRETGGAQKTRSRCFGSNNVLFYTISRSFPRTFEAPHLKDEAVRKVQSKNRLVKFVGVVFVLLLVVHLAIFVWEEVKLPGSTGSLLTEPFWYLWDVFL